MLSKENICNEEKHIARKTFGFDAVELLAKFFDSHASTFDGRDFTFCITNDMAMRYFSDLTEKVSNNVYHLILTPNTDGKNVYVIIKYGNISDRLHSYKWEWKTLTHDDLIIDYLSENKGYDYTRLYRDMCNCLYKYHYIFWKEDYEGFNELVGKYNPLSNEPDFKPVSYKPKISAEDFKRRLNEIVNTCKAETEETDEETEERYELIANLHDLMDITNDDDNSRIWNYLYVNNLDPDYGNVAYGDLDDEELMLVHGITPEELYALIVSDNSYTH